ncbi:MAG: GLUG motif-containing protein, partial [Phycisphaerales bacterium]
MANLLKTTCYSKRSKQISKSIILLGLLTVILLCYEAKAQFDGGTGEPENPYRIATAEQLISIGSDPNLLDKHFVLVNDIDLDPNLPGGQIFTQAVIAPRVGEIPYPKVSAFNGSFNGNGYRIKHLTIRGGTRHMLGLFGKTGEEAQILNLGLENVSIKVDGSSCVGALSGLNHGYISHCSSNGKISSINRSGILGGLVGDNHGGSITKCYADCEISGEQGDIIKSDYLGGIVGMNWFFGRISNCYASGAVTGDHMVGGLVGSNLQANISNCYAIGNVSGSSSVGGLAGYNGQYSIIINCFAIGHISTVSESDGVGGFVGGNGEKAIITGCFWDIEKSSVQISEGGKGLTTAEMMDIQTYLAAGWDFIDELANGTVGLWQMPGSTGYPQLTVFSDLYRPPTLTGNGTPEYPYRIATAEDLGAVCHNNPSACYRLMADIDLSGITWTSAPVWYFDGRFDGNGCVVSNMTINGGGHLGLFGILDKHATVKNLGVANANIVGREYGSYFGVLAARNRGDINGCYATGTICGQKNSIFIGGLVGSNTGTLSNCYTNGSVSGGHTIGGLAGYSYEGMFTNCYTTNNVAGKVEGLD